MDVKYVIKRGDSLRDLAARYFGDPAQWPLIYEHNNLPQVMALTGSRILDPDLVFVGQVIYIPKLVGILNRSLLPPQVGLKPLVLNLATGFRARDPAVKGYVPDAPYLGAGKVAARPRVRSIPFRYPLADVPTIRVASAKHVAVVTLKGSVILQARDTVDFPSVSRKGFELKVKQKADQVFGKLIGGTKVGYNAGTNEISFENGFVRRATVRLAPRVGVVTTTTTQGGLPEYKGAVIKKPALGSGAEGGTPGPSVPGTKVESGAPSGAGLSGAKGSIKGDTSYRESETIFPVEPRTETTVSVSPQPGTSVLKATIAAPAVRAKIDGHVYVARDVIVEIELAPKPSSEKPPMGGARSDRAPAATPFTWEYLVPAGAVVGKGVLIKSAIVQDILTLAEGVADDVPTFAVAVTALVGGSAKMQAVRGVDPIPVEGQAVSTGQRLA